MNVEIYWCVNCGHKAKAKRKDQTACDNCGYVGISAYELSEIMEDKLLIERFKDCLNEPETVKQT